MSSDPPALSFEAFCRPLAALLMIDPHVLGEEVLLQNELGLDSLDLFRVINLVEGLAEGFLELETIKHLNTVVDVYHHYCALHSRRSR